MSWIGFALALSDFLPHDLVLVIGSIYLRLNKPPTLYPISFTLKHSYSFDKIFSTTTPIPRPSGVTVGQDRSVYFSDSKKHLVSVFNHKGKFLTMFGFEGSKPGQLDSPSGLTTDKNLNILVCDYGNKRIQVWNPENKFLYGFQVGGSPIAVAILSNRKILVLHLSTGYGFIVSLFSVEGKILIPKIKLRSGSGYSAEYQSLKKPTSMVVDNKDNIYIGDGGKVRIFDSYGLALRDLSLCHKEVVSSYLVDREGCLVVVIKNRVLIIKADGSVISEIKGEWIAVNSNESLLVGNLPTTIHHETASIFS